MRNKRGEPVCLIGVTGGIGSGKSLVCSYFEQLGGKVFYADDIAKSLYRKDKKLADALVKRFGKQMIDNNRISLERLKDLVLKNVKEVNRIVHPFVIRDILQKVRTARSRMVFVEAALIFESGFHKYLDYTVLISSTLRNRVMRVRKKRKIPVREIKRIASLQMPEREKKSRADIIIKNDSTRTKLRHSAERTFKILTFLCG